MLPISAPPQPPHRAELWGAESLQRPTHTRELQHSLVAICLYLTQKSHILLSCRSISSTLSRCNLVLVPTIPFYYYTVLQISPPFMFTPALIYVLQ